MVTEKGVSKWGVIPFRGTGNENIEFLIVSTKNGNWGLPKGNLMKKLGSKGRKRTSARTILHQSFLQLAKRLPYGVPWIHSRGTNQHLKANGLKKKRVVIFLCASSLSRIFCDGQLEL